MRALVYFREGEYTIGRRLISSGHGLLGQAAPSRERNAVAGQLHLGACIIAARARDRGAVDTHLTEARAHAERVGEAVDVHWLSFGPTNVAAHAVSATIEMREYGRAPGHASEFAVPKDWPVSRAAHLHVDQLSKPLTFAGPSPAAPAASSG